MISIAYYCNSILYNRKKKPLKMVNYRDTKASKNNKVLSKKI